MEEAQRDGTNPDDGALGLGSLRLRPRGSLLSAPAAVSPGDRPGCPVRTCSRPGPSSARPLLNAIQQPDQEDVTGELIDGALHQSPALGTAQLPARSYNALQTAAAEGVLTGQDLRRGVQALQADGAFEEIQQNRLVHPPGSASGSAERQDKQRYDHHVTAIPRLWPWHLHQPFPKNRTPPLVAPYLLIPANLTS